MKLAIEKDTLHIKLNPLEILLAHRGSLHLPLDHITAVSATRPPRDWAQVRAPGTHIPFIVKAGTYVGRDGREFWYATLGMPYLVIDLVGWDYRRLVMTLSDSGSWAARIERARQAQPSAGA
jgi:hypothetical protein